MFDYGVVVLDVQLPLKYFSLAVVVYVSEITVVCPNCERYSA